MKNVDFAYKIHHVVVDQLRYETYTIHLTVFYWVWIVLLFFRRYNWTHIIAYVRCVENYGSGKRWDPIGYLEFISWTITVEAWTAMTFWLHCQYHQQTNYEKKKKKIRIEKEEQWNATKSNTYTRFIAHGYNSQQKHVKWHDMHYTFNILVHRKKIAYTLNTSQYVVGSILFSIFCLCFVSLFLFLSPSSLTLSIICV